MNEPVTIRRWHWRAAALPVAAIAVLLPLFSAAADGVSLEGTWKIAAPQTSFTPEGGAVPFTAKGRQRYLQNKKAMARHDYDSYDIARARCALPGVPRLMLTPERFRIWQRPGLLMMQFEWNRTFRQIDTGVSQRVKQTRSEGNYLEGVGRAVPVATGHWEGDTLVATSEDFSDNTLIDALVPHGLQLKVAERLRLRDNDTLEERITIEDPDYFTHPWQTSVLYKRQPDLPFREDVCLDRIAAGQLAF